MRKQLSIPGALPAWPRVLVWTVASPSAIAQRHCPVLLPSALALASCWPTQMAAHLDERGRASSWSLRAWVAPPTSFATFAFGVSHNGSTGFTRFSLFFQNTRGLAQLGGDVRREVGGDESAST